nr:Hpt domain-containing protein [Desulfobulbaceae bacterium]
MESSHALEFQKETSKLFENISSSLSKLQSGTADNSLFHQHYLYWHEIKSLASLFSLTDIATIAHQIESLFDLVSTHRISLSQIDINCFTETIDYINASLNMSIHNQPHTLSLENLLSKIHHISGTTAGTISSASEGAERPGKQATMGHNYTAKILEKKNISTRCNIVVQTAIQSITQLTSLAKKECVQEIIRKPISPSRINECLSRYCLSPYAMNI